MIDTVIFRKWPKENNAIIALFPDIVEKPGECLSYRHIGQHSAANYLHMIEQTVPAKVNEHLDLLEELISIGYTLQIRKRRSN